MAILSQPAFGPRMSLIYITVGALLDVWTTVFYFAYHKDGSGGEMTNRAWFWLVGLFLTGVTLILIGALLGTIGQAARRAELPPDDAIEDDKEVKKATGNPPPAPAAGGPVPVMPQPVYYPQVVPPAPGQPMPPAVPAPSAPAVG